MTEYLGEEVRSVELAGGGFTHGFSAVLRGASKSLFAKAAAATDGFLYPAYLLEGQVLRALPDGLPMPGFRNAESVDVERTSWQLLPFDAVAGYMRGQPWTGTELAAVHESLLAVEAGLAGLAGLPQQFHGQNLARTAQCAAADRMAGSTAWLGCESNS